MMASSLLWVLLASLTALLLAFSQTVAFYGDEGVHLLAARLVNTGRRLYLDFFYPHAPLYVYISATWMRVVGDTRRSVHALSALCSSANAASAALLMRLNVLVMWYGTIGQPYGLSLFLIVAAFLLVVASVDRFGGPQPFLVGVCAGTAAASLLLTAPVAPILCLWLLRHARPGDRFKTGASSRRSRPLLLPADRRHDPVPASPDDQSL